MRQALLKKLSFKQLRILATKTKLVTANKISVSEVIGSPIIKLPSLSVASSKSCNVLFGPGRNQSLIRATKIRNRNVAEK